MRRKLWRLELNHFFFFVFKTNLKNPKPVLELLYWGLLKKPSISVHRWTELNWTEVKMCLFENFLLFPFKIMKGRHQWEIALNLGKLCTFWAKFMPHKTPLHSVVTRLLLNPCVCCQTNTNGLSKKASFNLPCKCFQTVSLSILAYF